MWHVWERREMRTRFWWENLKERNLFEDLGISDKVILKQISVKMQRVDWINLA
jgi:hypothetical protein